MKTMAIVASGSVVLGRGMGKEIDAHEGVTRFGGAEWSIDLGCNKEDVGERFTHWVINGHAPALHRCRDRSYMGYYEGVTILFKERNWGKKFRVPHIGLKTRTRKSLKRNGVHYRTLTRGACKEKLKKLGLKRPRGCFSAGFQAVMDTVGRFDKVTLFGFNHMYPEDMGRGHYYDKGKWVDGGHHLGEESRVLIELCRMDNAEGTNYIRGG